MSNSEEAPLKMANRAASLPNSDQALNSGNTEPCDDLKILTPQQASLWNSLSPKVRKQVLILREIQKQHDEFEAKFREEKAALEARYQKLYEPLYSKRYDIVNGHVEVDVTDGAAEENKEDGVPEFWLNAMKTNEVLALQITERDEGALKYLKDIRSSKTDSPKGFKLDFYFASNPYFKNPVLTKTYQMVEEDDDEPILERAIGTVIEWYPGKNLTQKVLKKKTAKGAKNSKPITKTEKCESFFNFFDPPEVPDDDDEIDDDVAEQLQETLEEDYDIGSTIRDKIIPHAVSWFTGEALQGEDFEDGDDDSEDDEEDDEGEGDEDDDDDDDDDDDEEDGRGVTGRKPSASLTKPGQKVSMAQPADCKQQ